MNEAVKRPARVVGASIPTGLVSRLVKPRKRFNLLASDWRLFHLRYDRDGRFDYVEDLPSGYTGDIGGNAAVKLTFTMTLINETDLPKALRKLSIVLTKGPSCRATELLRAEHLRRGESHSLVAQRNLSEIQLPPRRLVTEHVSAFPRALLGRDAHVVGAAFVQGGSRLVSVDASGTVKDWDLAARLRQARRVHPRRPAPRGDARRRRVGDLPGLGCRADPAGRVALRRP